LSRSDVLASPPQIPASPGVYGWYFNELPHPDIDPKQCTRVEGMPLLYVGIAPRSATSHATIRTRLRQHFAGNVGGSTLRFTLGSLLSDRLQLRLGAKARTYGDGESRLNSWMQAHAFVTFVNVSEPWTIERDTLASLDLPLNLDMNLGHPFHPRLSAARAKQLKLLRSVTEE
jgi:hypothetical protein